MGLALVLLGVGVGAFRFSRRQKKSNDVQRRIQTESAALIHDEYSFEMTSLKRTIKENANRDAERRGTIVQLQAQVDDKQLEVEESKTLLKNAIAKNDSQQQDLKRLGVKNKGLEGKVSELQRKLRNQADNIARTEDVQKQYDQKLSAKESTITKLRKKANKNDAKMQGLVQKYKETRDIQGKVVTALKIKHKREKKAMREKHEEHVADIERHWRGEIKKVDRTGFAAEKSAMVTFYKKEMCKLKWNRHNDMGLLRNRMREEASKLRDEAANQATNSISDLRDKLEKAEAEAKCAKDARFDVDTEDFKVCAWLNWQAFEKGLDMAELQQSLNEQKDLEIAELQQSWDKQKDRDIAELRKSWDEQKDLDIAELKKSLDKQKDLNDSERQQVQFRDEKIADLERQLEKGKEDEEKQKEEAKVAENAFRNLQQKYKELAEVHARCPSQQSQNSETKEEPNGGDSMNVDSPEQTTILRLEGKVSRLGEVEAENDVLRSQLGELRTALQNGESSELMDTREDSPEERLREKIEKEFREQYNSLQNLLNEQQLKHTKLENKCKAREEALEKQLRDAITKQAPPAAAQAGPNGKASDDGSRKPNGEINAAKQTISNLKKALRSKTEEYDSLDRLLYKTNPQFSTEYRASIAELEQLRATKESLEAKVESMEADRQPQQAVEATSSQPLTSLPVANIAGPSIPTAAVTRAGGPATATGSHSSAKRRFEDAANDETYTDQLSKKPMTRISRYNKIYNSSDAEKSEETAPESPAASDVRTAPAAALTGPVGGATVPATTPGTCNVCRFRCPHCSSVQVTQGGSATGSADRSTQVAEDEEMAKRVLEREVEVREARDGKKKES